MGRDNVIVGKSLVSALIVAILSTNVLVPIFHVSGFAEEAKIFVESRDSIYYTSGKSTGDTFQVNVTVANVTGMVGMQFEFRWDPSLLNCTSITEYLFHTVTPTSEWDNIFEWLLINNTGGYASYMCLWPDYPRAEDGGYAPVNITAARYTEGKVTAAVLEFKILKVPTEAEGYLACNLDLASTIMADQTANPIPHTVEDGYYKLTRTLVNAQVALANTQVVNAPAYSVYFIQTENPYDVQGIGYVYGMCTNPQHLRMMNDSSTVELDLPDFGKPLVSNMVIVLFGGPLAHYCTAYYERTAQTPLLFTMTAYGSGLWGFIMKDGSTVPDAYLDMRELNLGHTDLFTVETFIDSDGNFVVVMYGITEWGTLAAGTYFYSEILPKIENFPGSWYIFRWNDGIDEQPYDSFPQPEEMTLVASGN